MAVELKVPPAGESITEVQIGEWLKKEGDAVRRDEVLVVIETDKVTVEVAAPEDGILSKILVRSGQDAAVGDVVGLFEPGAVAAAPAAGARPAEAKASASPVEAAPPPPPPPVATGDRPSGPPASVRDSIPPQGFARVMPAARRAAADAGIDPASVTPSGPGGRVLKE